MKKEENLSVYELTQQNDKFRSVVENWTHKTKKKEEIFLRFFFIYFLVNKIKHFFERFFFYPKTKKYI